MNEKRIEEIMSQVQTFASAWSILGGRFDFGNGLEDAEHEREVLREMIKCLKPEVPEGYALVPDFRGYANLGTGNYMLDHSRDDIEAELIISIATDEQKEGRVVGDWKDKESEAIQPEVIAVRIGFSSVAGLDALEQQLRFLREAHFPTIQAVKEQALNAAWQRDPDQ